MSSPLVQLLRSGLSWLVVGVWCLLTLVTAGCNSGGAAGGGGGGDPPVMTALAITPPAPSLAKGFTTELVATATYSDLTTRDVTGEVSWTSSDPAVATVGSDEATGGRVATLDVGTVQITAVDPASGLATNVTLTVTPAVLVEVAVAPQSATLALGYTRPFTATGRFSDATTVDLTTSVSWTSSSAAATVASDGLATAVAVGTTTITATHAASGLAGVTFLTVTPAQLVTLTLSPVAPSRPLGLDQQFTATGTFSDNTTLDVTTAVLWSSSDPAVATVGNSAGTRGYATSVALGTTTITATAPGGSKSATTTFTVTAVQLVAITVTPPVTSVPAGLGRQFSATGVYSDDSTQDITTWVTWSTAAPAVATVSNAFGSQGLATGAAPGSTTVLATDPATLVSGTANLTVSNAVLVGISVTPPVSTFATGFVQQLTAIGTYSDNTTQDVTTLVSWTTNDPNVATVGNTAGQHGQVTGVASGATTILATQPGSLAIGIATVNVSPAVLVGIDVTPVASALALGTTRQFTATALFSDNSTQDVTGTVTWSSSQPAVATVGNAVGNHGFATSLAVGTTTISATDPGSAVVGSTTLLVTPAVLVGLTVAPLAASLALGYEQQFTATGTFSDNTTQDVTTAVTWSSSQPALVVIGNGGANAGRATTVGVGASTITATDPATNTTATTVLTVTPAVLVGLAIDPPTATVALGYTQQFTAIGTFSDNSTQDLTAAVTWSSSNAGAASLGNAPAAAGLATSSGVGAATVTAVHPATSLQASAALTIAPAVLVAIDVTPTLPSQAAGYEQQFTATGTFSDNSTQDVTGTVTWSSSQPAVATIGNAPGSHGRAQGLAAGVTTIQAIDPATSVAASTVFEVTPAVLVGLAITPPSPALPLGLTQAFTATGTFSDNTTQDLTAAVTWTSSNPAVAALANAPGSPGVATALALGTVTVTATEPASSQVATTTLDVTPAVLVALGVATTSNAVPLGMTRQFVATGTFSDNTTQDLTAAVTWSSSQPAVAALANAPGQAGLATTLATGAVLVTAIDAATSVTGTATLTVTPAVLTALDVTPASPSAALGTTRPFTATGTFSDSSTQDLTAAVTWSSSDAGKATISNASGSEGLATTVATGSTTITAIDPATSIAASTVLTVTPAVLVTLVVTPASPSAALGTTRPFTATGTFSDNSTQDLTAAVTWSSSDAGKATIANASGSEGLATTVAPGTTTITALDPATSVTGSTVFTVTPAVLIALSVTPPSPSLALGYTVQFTATGTFSDLSTQDLTTAVTWSTSDVSRATIANAPGLHGRATAVGVGGLTVVATDPATSVAASTPLTVTSAVLVALSITPTNPSLTLGADQQFTATGTYSDNSTQDLTTSVTWSSSAPGVATIGNTAPTQGLATSVAQGSTTITATHPLGYLATTLLTVADPIAMRSVASATAATGVLSLAIARPTGVIAGDVLVAGIVVRPNTATVTPPAGWTLVRRSNATAASAHSLLVFRRVATAAEPASHTWTFSASQGSAGCVLAFDGVDTTTPIDVENGQATASSLTHATPSVTTTTANTMLVTFHTMARRTTWTAPAGMTEVADIANGTTPSNSGVCLLASRVFQPTAGATGSKTATAASNAGSGNACLVALRD